jgi:hypothetical protein
MSSWLQSVEISEVRNNLSFANRIQLDFRSGTQERAQQSKRMKTKKAKQTKRDAYANLLSNKVRF